MMEKGAFPLPTMKSVPRSLALIGSIACLCASGATVQAQSRIRTRIDAGWKFRRDPLAPSAAASQFHWEWRDGTASRLDTDLPADLDSGNWKEAHIGGDVFHGRQGFAWFRTALDAKTTSRILHFEAVDDNAAVFLNGKRLTTHKGWDDPFDVDLSSAWKAEGPNHLVVLVENTAGGGGISGSVEFVKIAPEEASPEEAKPGYGDQSWRTVHLPHDYVVEGTFDKDADTGHGSLPVTTAWYRKSLMIPASYRGRSLWIDFDGVYRNSTVYMNGRKLGNHPGGYDGFRYDITHAVKYGATNILAVRVDPRKPEGWWYEGGGIYRHVWLNAANPVHVTPWGTCVTSTVNNGARHASAELKIQTTVTNDAARGHNFRVESRVIGPNGEAVGSVVTPGAIVGKAAVTLTQSLNVPTAALWSIETPQLYRVQTVVTDDENATDETATSFGIRTIRFDADKGFFLNGKHVEIQGTCNHQDHAGVGIAIPDRLFDARIKRLKEMGSNAYRCSHNPPAAELLDACDRLGMIVMDETRHLGDTEHPKSSTTTPYSDLTELKNMLLRDRNHPSIVMWSMANEEPIQSTEAGARIFSAMKEVTRQLDPTRPVTSAMNGGWGYGITLVEDLQGMNYNIGGYDAFHKKFPKLPAYGSETASTVSTRGIYTNDADKGYVSARDVNAPDWGATAGGGWKPIAERPWMAGGYVWTGFDYKGEPTPYGWPCINSHFGIMDICGFAKDNFYYYKSWWGDEPVVHLLPHWNWAGKEGIPIEVWCHSNADRVELFLNGKSLGTKDMPRYGHLEWSVPYQPGELIAKGYCDGKVIATDRVSTTGKATALRVTTDRKTLLADGEDLVQVNVDVVDAQGRVVPEADNLVQFSVQGAGQVSGVGNGDPSSHEPDKASQRHAFNGKCMVLVGAKDAAGDIILTVSSTGMTPQTIHFTAK